MRRQSKPGPVLLNAAIYIRVSSETQARTGDSLRDQMESCQEYIDKHENMVLFDTYIDDGVSGQKLARDDFSRLMQDVQAEKINLILFTKLDRWFRSLRHYLNTQEILERHNVSWIAIDQPYFDTSTPHGRAFVNQSMMWAELEAQNDSTRIIDVFNNKVKYGEVLSGKAPRGYSIVDKHLVPNDDAPMIRDIFEYYRQTTSLGKTLRKLKDDYGVVMTLSNLRQSILMNKKYIGVFRDNDHYCEPIVDRDLFDAVQALLSKNIKINQKYNYIFSGLLVCNDCGYRICGCHINVLSRGHRYKYPAYECKRAGSPYYTCCNKGEIREKTVEEYMITHVEDAFREYMAEYHIKSSPAADNRNKKSGIKRKLDRLKDLYLNEVISLNEYKRDRIELQKQLDEIPDIIEPVKDFTPMLHALDYTFKHMYHSFDNVQKRAFWQSIIKEVRISHSENRHRQYHIIFL